MSANERLRVAAVLPVRGHPSLLDGCLAALRTQATPVDELIVVDDSPDASLGEIAGARVLRSRGRGPYVARNLGWRDTDADVILFLDIRSRPRPQWGRRLCEAFLDSDVAIAGSEVRVLGGAPLGARAGERQQFFRLRYYVEKPSVPPYLPTCNLAVRRDDLAAVDGFGAVRSGGDADLCWRILRRPGRRLEPIPDVLMDWVPRERLRDYLEQNYRYGKSHHALRREWAAQGLPQLDPMPHRELAKRLATTGARAGVATLRRRPDVMLDHVVGGAGLVFQLGYRVAADTERWRGSRGTRFTRRLPGTAPAAGGRRVAVFRETFLPPSETFVRDHLLNLPSWTPVVLTTHRLSDGLQVPSIAIADANRLGVMTRARRAVARARGADDEQTREVVLADLLRRERVDLVHAHFGPDAALIRGAARRAGLPLVATFHGYDATMYPEFLRRGPAGARLVDEWDSLMRDVAAVITVSGFLRDELVARGADPERLHVIPCGVDTATMPWSVPPADGGVLFVGRLVEKKGCADLLDAVARLSRRPRVRIIGDGPLRGPLEDRAAELGIDAEFTGVGDSGQVRAAMREASLVAMPSRRAHSGDCEGLPVVSLEASAMGRPVVGYRHSGLVESVISGETGLLAEEGDVGGLAQLLDALLGDAVELERLGRNARRHVEEHFELRSCLQRVERVYEQVAGRRVEGGSS
jgi:colanic acid/amylovoran biosynthesis glycosyltransferase